MALPKSEPLYEPSETPNTHQLLITSCKTTVHAEFSNIPLGESTSYGDLKIPEFSLPQQSLKMFTQPFENHLLFVFIKTYNQDVWPEFSFEFIFDLKAYEVIPKTFTVTLGKDNLDADLLYVKCMLYLNKALKFTFDCRFFSLKFTISPFDKDVENSFIEKAKICLKLKYIGQCFNHTFIIPTKVVSSIPTKVITSAELRSIDFTFRALTEGRVSVRSRDFGIYEVAPNKLDLNKPPFTMPGAYDDIRQIEWKSIIFNRQFNLGPSSIHIGKATPRDTTLIDQLRKKWDRPANIVLIVLDQEIVHQFYRYLPKNQKEERKLRQRLESFRNLLNKLYFGDIVYLLNEPLVKDITKEEAVEVVMDWLLYSVAPNYLFPADPTDTENHKQWHVDVWLSDEHKKDGIKKVGIAIVNKKTSKISHSTPIQELKDKVLETHGMFLLEKSANEQNESEFLSIIKSMNWKNNSADDYLKVIKLALDLNNHSLAYNLSIDGICKDPANENLKKYFISFKLESLEKEALKFIKAQFGNEEKWEQINQPIWEFFKSNKGFLLGISYIKEIAFRKDLSLQNFLSVLSLLASYKGNFINLVYYQQENSGKIEEIPNNQIMKDIQYYYSQNKDKWQGWATNILVGWEPIINTNYFQFLWSNNECQFR